MSVTLILSFDIHMRQPVLLNSKDDTPPKFSNRNSIGQKSQESLVECRQSWAVGMKKSIITNDPPCLPRIFPILIQPDAVRTPHYLTFHRAQPRSIKQVVATLME
jgi:hypothetical protein